MYMHVYVYTYNSQVFVFSSYPISGKRGFLHYGKAGKITDYFFFEKLALSARIMKFKHLSGGNSNYCSLLDAGKAHYFLFGKRSSFGLCTIMWVYRYRCVMLLYVWCLSLTLIMEISFISTLCRNFYRFSYVFPRSWGGPDPRTKRVSVASGTSTGARPALLHKLPGYGLGFVVAETCPVQWIMWYSNNWMLHCNYVSGWNVIRERPLWDTRSASFPVFSQTHCVSGTRELITLLRNTVCMNWEICSINTIN